MVTHDHGEGDECLKGCKGFPLKGGETFLDFPTRENLESKEENTFERRLKDV